LVNYRLVVSGEGQTDWLAGIVGALEGRAAALFVVLAGVGLSLMSATARRSGTATELSLVRRRLWKRSVLLVVVGLAYSPIWPADILHFYGFYIALGACLLAAKDRHLLVAAGGFVVGFLVLLFVWDYEQGWDFATMSYTDFWSPGGMVRHIFFNGFHPVVPWTAFLLLGMWLGRQDVLAAARRRRLLMIAGGVWLGTELLSAAGLAYYFARHPMGMSEEIIAMLVDTQAMPPMPQYMLSAGASAVVVALLSVGFCQRFAQVGVVQVLRRTGQLSLTLYVGHVVLGMGVLEALGRLGGQSTVFAVGAAIVFCLLGVAFAEVWLRFFRAGPLEMLFRKLT
jgi:uncharacterized membrane protein YeiB